jgi:hypothetical protein
MAQQQISKTTQRWRVQFNIITERYFVVRGDDSTECLTGRSGFPLYFSSQAPAMDAARKANDKAEGVAP